MEVGFGIFRFEINSHIGFVDYTLFTGNNSTVALGRAEKLDGNRFPSLFAIS